MPPEDMPASERPATAAPAESPPRERAHVRASRAPRHTQRAQATDRPEMPIATPAVPPAQGVPTRPARRRVAGAQRVREGGVLGLADRTRLFSDHALPHLLPDALNTALPAIRRLLLHRPLDEAVRATAEALARVLAPAVAQVWIADPSLWAGTQQRIGGLQLTPALRLVASISAVDAPPAEPRIEPFSPRAEAARASAADAERAAHPAAPSDPLVEDVATTRRPVVLLDAKAHAHAAHWSEWLGAPSDALGALAPLPHAPGTVVAYPLLARGQCLGVLALGLAGHLIPRQLAAVEEFADLLALAADRDRLLSYSRSQEALAQTVVLHAPVAMAVMTGPEHMLALANPAFAMLLGMDTASDQVGRRLAEVAPARAASLIASLRLSAVFASGTSEAMVELPIHLDRGMTYWNVVTSPLPGISAAVAGVLVSAVDVTRQVLTRQRAQESAEMAQERIGQMMMLHATSLAVAGQLGADPSDLLRDILRRSISLLDARAGTVYARDPRANELRVVVCQGLRGDYVGQRIRIGEGLAGQIARTGKGLIVDDYRAYPFRAAMYANEPFSAVIAVPLLHHGQVVGVLDVLDDAERRAFSEDDLWLLDLFASQAAQAIENARTYVELEHAYRKQRELDRMKDDFIATASHELRTPLTGVQGFLDLLLDYAGSRDEPLALDFLRKAADSAQELAEIAERLLQTSRLDTGRMELHTTAVRLAPVVAEVLRSYADLQQAQGTMHELVAEVPADVYVHADLGRLREVLDNLVGNAIKYSPRGGQIRVRCVPASATRDAVATSAADGTSTRDDAPAVDPLSSPIEEHPTLELAHLGRDSDGAMDAAESPTAEVLAAARTQQYFTLLVSDAGMGIAPSERARLFGRFARTEEARTSQIRGTGLGLYICRQIARAMRGDVWLLESAPGQGSTFAVTLPGAPGHPPREEEHVASDSRPARPEAPAHDD